MFTAQTFHPLHEPIQLGGNLLESSFFKTDDFHCLLYFQLDIYSKIRNRTVLLQPIYHHVSSSIFGWKCDRFILFPLQIKVVEITLQWIFRPVTMRCPK